MTRLEHLLVIAMEECDETSQRASKALRFSPQEIQPDMPEQLTNAQRLFYEFNDLVAVMQLLVQENGFENIHSIFDQQAIELKKEKSRKIFIAL